MTTWRARVTSRPRGVRRLATALLVAALALAACSDDEPAGSSSVDTDIDVDVDVIIADLNAYWSEVDDELGFSYSPVPDSRVSTGVDGVQCDGLEIEPEEVEENAFVDGECDEGITVVYDPAYLGDSLVRTEATLAHEWGHVIQAQAADLDLSLDADGLPIDAELQADCFAGAWSANRARSDIDHIRTDTADIGDPRDVDIEDPEAHGTPEERVSAFDLGLDGGPAACIGDMLIDALFD